MSDEGLVISSEGFVGGVYEFDLLEEEVDGISFAELCGKIFDHAGFDHVSANATDAVTALAGDGCDFGIEVIL